MMCVSPGTALFLFFLHTPWRRIRLFDVVLLPMSSSLCHRHCCSCNQYAGSTLKSPTPLLIKLVNNPSSSARSIGFRICSHWVRLEDLPNFLLNHFFNFRRQLSPSTFSIINIFVGWHVAESQPEVLRSYEIGIRIDISIFGRNSYGQTRMGPVTFGPDWDCD